MTSRNHATHYQRGNMWALQVAGRLRSLRREKKLGQNHIGEHLGISVSEISRLERGRRKIRVDQVGPWAKSLGYKAELIIWETETGEDPGLDDDSLLVLTEVAQTLPHLPGPAREALVNQMRIWRQAD